MFSLNVSNTNIENMEVNYTTEFNYEEYIDTYIDSLDLKYDHQREFLRNSFLLFIRKATNLV